MEQYDKTATELEALRELLRKTRSALQVTEGANIVEYAKQLVIDNYVLQAQRNALLYRSGNDTDRPSRPDTSIKASEFDFTKGTYVDGMLEVYQQQFTESTKANISERAYDKAMKVLK